VAISETLASKAWFHQKLCQLELVQLNKRAFFVSGNERDLVFVDWSILNVQSLAVSVCTSWAEHGFYDGSHGEADTQQEAFQNFPIQLILDIVLATGRPSLDGVRSTRDAEKRSDSVVLNCLKSDELHD